MSDFPVQVVMFPLLALAAGVGMLLHRRSSIARYDREYSNFRAGVLAQRLGLTLVEGDPSFNVFIRQANIDVARGPKDSRPIQIKVRAEGAPDGVPLTFVYWYRVEQTTGFATVTWRIGFDCRLTALAKQVFPPFEVISRQAPLGPIAQTQPLPEQPTGAPEVDAAYQVTTVEPAMARLLGQLLPEFSVFQNAGVHLIGDGKSVSFVMKQDAAPLLANAIYYAETMATLVSRVAQRVGGA